MGRLGLILGSNALAPPGNPLADLAAAHGAEVLQRHGDPYLLPHRIDHEANLRALAAAGCGRALAIGSVGSLKAALPVGSFLCPDDFIALHAGPSIHEDVRAHSAPGFSPGWRRAVVEAWRDADPELRDGGVYWQTRGPRFETPAEIRLLASHAEVVGMTLASECVLARELGIDYAAVCVVDNLANGVGAREPSLEELAAAREANAAKLAGTLESVLPRLGGAGP